MTAEVFAILKSDIQEAYNFRLPPEAASTITKMVFDKLGVDLIHRTGYGRLHEHVEARQIAMFIIRKKTRASLKSIGNYFGRDHSTVIYSIETVNDMMQTNKFYKNKVEEILKECDVETEIEAL